MNDEIILIGKPNSGKSTLFNRLLRKKVVITHKVKGTTRDLVRYEFKIEDRVFDLIDSGGIGEGNDETYQDIVKKKVFEKLEEASLILIVISVFDFSQEDNDLLNKLRKFYGKILLIINKVDNDNLFLQAQNFLSLGVPSVFVSAEHGLYIDELKNKILQFFPKEENQEDILEDIDKDKPDEDDLYENDNEDGVYEKDDEEVEVQKQEFKNKGFSIAILGEPNSGKSSLLNYLTNNQSSIVSPLANTTRDVIKDNFVYKDQTYTIYDTAGIRKKTKVKEDVEYFSVIRAIDNIESVDVVILLIDALKDLSRQDKKISKLIIDRRKPVLIVFNKMDLLEDIKNTEESMIERTRYYFPILAFAPITFISTKTGKGIANTLEKCKIIYRQARYRVKTSKLNLKVRQWVSQSPPVVYKGKKRLKIKYVTQVDINPPKFIIFVNNTDFFNENYKRFLINKIRQELGFQSVPILLEFRNSGKEAYKRD